MWCSNCQQDVPAVGDAGTNRPVCSRCRHPLRPPHAVQICDEGVALDGQSPVTTVTSAPATDDWQLRQRTRELGRKLRNNVRRAQPQADRPPGNQQRFDPPQNLFDELEQIAARPIVTPTDSVATRHSEPPRRPEGGQFVAWLFALCGATMLGVGIGTIAWSLFDARADLWNPALGLTLAGQGLLIYGLLLVVTRLWRNSRYATGKLQEVHLELSQLQRTTEALTGARSGGTPAFYADLARGASPQILLSNLKGQLDQLTTRLGGDA